MMCSCVHNSPDLHLLVLLLVVLDAQFLQLQVLLGPVEAQLRSHEVSGFLFSFIILQLHTNI